MKSILVILIISLCFVSCNEHHQSQKQIIVQTFKDTIFNSFIADEIRDSVLNNALTTANKAYIPINEQLQFNGFYLVSQLNGFPMYRRRVCQKASDELNIKINLLTNKCLNEIYKDTAQTNTRFRSVCVADSIKICIVSRGPSQTLYELSFKKIKFKVIAVNINKDSVHYSIQKIGNRKVNKLQVVWRNSRFKAIIKEFKL